MCGLVLVTAFLLVLILPRSAALLCYRCDSHNHGPSCANLPATRHLRDFGEEEPCLPYETVNTQYLALQKDLDSEWYFSPRNGDHGLPVHLLVESSADSPSSSAQLTLIHADRDLACLYVRSYFHHSLDPGSPSSPKEPPPRLLFFRKCVQLPTLDEYPICRQAPIYKGHIELCLCRTDKCNYSLLETPHPASPPGAPPLPPNAPHPPGEPELILEEPPQTHSRALIHSAKSSGTRPYLSPPTLLILYLVKQ